ncbi:MAG: hypothetical protein PF505_05305 [Vallitaleaceae bacterium]|jgi:hypothetical protein|nr:hypothetical protein [Vallitaleaceae bacterium]
MDYYNRIHRTGRIWTSIVLVLILSVPVIFSLYYQVLPPFKNLATGFLTVFMVYFPVSIAEFLTYTPMLGSNASYLVFVTGNLTNLKIPCALMAMDLAKAKPQTDEGEVIAGIAVAVSSIVTATIVLIGMFLLIPLKPILESAVLAPAFENVLPALFGALAAYFISKQWKLAIVPLGLIVLLFVFIDIPVGVEGVFIPVLGAISVISARIMYKKGFIKAYKE